MAALRVALVLALVLASVLGDVDTFNPFPDEAGVPQSSYDLSEDLQEMYMNPAPSYDEEVAERLRFHHHRQQQQQQRQQQQQKQQQQSMFEEEPAFYYRMEPLKYVDVDGQIPFAVTPVDPRYYAELQRQQPESKEELKRAIKDDSKAQRSLLADEKLDEFEEPRQQRQNPNLAATKINRIVSPEVQEPINPKVHYGNKFSIERDIPTSLMPTQQKHQHVIQQALKNTANYRENMNVYLIYIYAMVAGIGAATAVAIAAFVLGWHSMRKKSKAAVDVEYPAYGITGPNTEVTPSGDRQLAHSAQMYHYQHQKQQIIAMKSRNPTGVPERNGSVSDAESDEENDEGDYTVYECPGFATTGEMEVKNPLFLDEPTPATQPQPAPENK